MQQTCQIHHLWISFGVGLQIWGMMQSQSLPHLKQVLTNNSCYSWFSGGITLAAVDKVHRFLSADFFIRQCYCTAVQLLIFLSPANKSLNWIITTSYFHETCSSVSKPTPFCLSPWKGCLSSWLTRRPSPVLPQANVMYLHLGNP